MLSIYLIEWNADFFQAGWARPRGPLCVVRQFFLLMINGKFPLIQLLVRQENQ